MPDRTRNSRPGILDWAHARLLRALQGATIFMDISQAQEWLGQQVAPNFYDPKDGYTFDIRRLLGDLLTSSFFGQSPMTPEVEAKVQDHTERHLLRHHTKGSELH